MPRAMRRLISWRERPHSLTASLIGIKALLWIISAAVTCASKSSLILFTFMKSVIAHSFHRAIAL